MIKVGRWANEHKHAAAAILDKQTFYRDVEHTFRGIEHIDMVPNLSPQNLVSVEISKDFMLSHGYIKNDFDVRKWAAPEFLEKAAKDLLEQQWKKATTAKLPETTGLQLASRRIGQSGEALAGCTATDAGKPARGSIREIYLPARAAERAPLAAIACGQAQCSRDGRGIQDGYRHIGTR